MDTYDNTETDDLCEWCGKQPGIWSVDPYIQELDGETVEVFACEDCLYNRAMDI